MTIEGMTVDEIAANLYIPLAGMTAKEIAANLHIPLAGMTADEIATELGINRDIVYGRIKRRNIEPLAYFCGHKLYDRSVLPLIAEDLPTGAANPKYKNNRKNNRKPIQKIDSFKDVSN